MPGEVSRSYEGPSDVEIEIWQDEDDFRKPWVVCLNVMDDDGVIVQSNTLAAFADYAAAKARAAAEARTRNLVVVER